MEAFRTISKKFAEIDSLRSELAVYLCEDANNLSLEELFSTMKTFRGLFIKALKVRRSDVAVFNLVRSSCNLFFYCPIDVRVLSTVCSWRE